MQGRDNEVTLHDLLLQSGISITMEDQAATLPINFVRSDDNLSGQEPQTGSPGRGIIVIVF